MFVIVATTWLAGATVDVVTVDVAVAVRVIDGGTIVVVGVLVVFRKTTRGTVMVLVLFGILATDLVPNLVWQKVCE